MIALNNVSAGYNNRNVLHNISFTINKGESLSIIGPNGCGKTTLLKAIANIIPFEGEINLNNKPVKNMKVKELATHIAMLSQLTSMSFSYTVFDTVMMGRYVYRSKSFFPTSSSKHDTVIVNNMLKKVGIYNLKHRQVDTLSGGQLQRVFLAKVFAQNPSIILLDEPTNHLDLSYQIKLIQFLKHWAKQENKIVIGVLHDINLAMSLSDNLILLENGNVKAYGKAKEIISSGVLNSVYKINIADFMVKTLKKWEGM